MENIVRKNDSENTIQVLMDAARSMIISESEVRKVTEMVVKSCDTQGTKGADHKSLLLTKIENLNRLAVLYRHVSEKYVGVAVKLADGFSEDKVMAELHQYNISLNDQLNSEHECYAQVLSMLRA